MLFCKVPSLNMRPEMRTNSTMRLPLYGKHRDLYLGARLFMAVQTTIVIIYSCYNRSFVPCDKLGIFYCGDEFPIISNDPLHLPRPHYMIHWLATAIFNKEIG